MKLKEKIELEANDYSRGFDEAKIALLHGAYFAIKAVIEILEKRRIKYSKIRDKNPNLDAKILLGCRKREISEIINLLKSEA